MGLKNNEEFLSTILWKCWCQTLFSIYPESVGTGGGPSNQASSQQPALRPVNSGAKLPSVIIMENIEAQVTMAHTLDGKYEIGTLV